MAYVYFILIISCCGYAACNVLSNVRLVNHVGFAVDVISETMRTVERNEWCNLKLPDLEVDLNETVIDHPVIGKVRYFDGFLVSIQYVDIQQTTVNQVWSFNRTDDTATVSVRGTLRMHSVTLGYDVTADLEDGNHRYTATFVHPMISFAFSINKNIHEDSITVEAVGSVPRTANLLSVRPADNTSDVLTTLFDSTTTAAGIIAWGEDVFAPIALELVTETIGFPALCYNCAA